MKCTVGLQRVKPWIEANPKYKEINVESALLDQKSIFYHYKHLIDLRKKYDVITTGDFTLLYRDHPSLFAYKRNSELKELFVLCNFKDEELLIENTSLFNKIIDAELIVQNYSNFLLDKVIKLRPFEAVVFYSKLYNVLFYKNTKMKYTLIKPSQYTDERL